MSRNSVLDVLALDGNRMLAAGIDVERIWLDTILDSDRELWVGRPVEVRLFNEDFVGWIEDYSARPKFSTHGESRPRGPFDVHLTVLRRRPSSPDAPEVT